MAVDGCDLVDKGFNVALDFLRALEDVRVWDSGEGIFHDLVEVVHLWSWWDELKLDKVIFLSRFGFEGKLFLDFMIVKGVLDIEAKLSVGTL